MTIARRSLLGLSAAAAAASFAPLTEALAKAPVADRRTIAEVLAMRPEDMALASPRIAVCRRILVKAAKELSDTSLSRTILTIFENPAPTIAAQKEAGLLTKLKDEKLIDAARTSVLPPAGNPRKSQQPFWTAPGSGWKSHHAYPGGLAVHCAVNVLSAIRLCDTYKEATGLMLDRNAAVGGELLHDLHKPWVFAWQKDHTCRKEEPLAKTGEHHVLSIAESMKRGVAPAVCVAQACAHEVPGTPAGEALVAGWLRAAAVISDKDPAEYGVARAPHCSGRFCGASCGSRLCGGGPGLPVDGGGTADDFPGEVRRDGGKGLERSAQLRLCKLHGHASLRAVCRRRGKGAGRLRQ